MTSFGGGCMAVTGSGRFLKRGMDRCVTGAQGCVGSWCVTGGRQIAHASGSPKVSAGDARCADPSGRKPACRLGRQAWTAPVGCGFARRLDGAAGAALCPSLALLAARAPAVRLRPPRWRAVAKKPTPRLACGCTLACPTRRGRAGARGEGVAFLATARQHGGGAVRPPTTTAALGRSLLPCLQALASAFRQCPHRRRPPPGPRRGLGRSALDGQPPLRGSLTARYVAGRKRAPVNRRA